MTRGRVGRWAAVVGLVLVATACAVDLGTLPGGVSSVANAINDAGVIVGSSTEGTGANRIVRAYRKPSGRPMEALAPLPGYPHSAAHAINEHGVIVGQASRVVDGVSSTRAVRWDADGTPHDLGSFGGPNATAADINDHGVIVGNSGAGGVSASTTRFPVVWAPGATTPTPLPELPGAVYTVTAAINNAGTIVGSGTKTYEDGHALKWVGPIHQIVDLEPNLPAYDFVAAYDINAAGDIVGQIGWFGEAALWRAGTPGATRVGRLEERKMSEARAIGDDGSIAGRAEVTGGSRAFRWDPATGAMTDLGTLGGTASAVLALDRRGIPVGWGTRADGTQIAAVFVP